MTAESSALALGGGRARVPLLVLAGGAGVAVALSGLASDPIVAASLVVLGLLVGAAQQALP